MVKTYLAVMMGGAVGTGLRMCIANWMSARFGDSFPLGTLAVNVLGCFVIGLFAALTAPDGVLSASLLARQTIIIGVLGGFTTFSSFSHQTLQLLQVGAWGRAGWNVMLSVALCMLAVWLGHLLAGLFQQS